MWCHDARTRQPPELVVGVRQRDVIADVPKVDIRQRRIILGQTQMVAEVFGKCVGGRIAVQGSGFRTLARVLDRQPQMRFGRIVDEFEFDSEAVAAQ